MILIYMTFKTKTMYTIDTIMLNFLKLKSRSFKNKRLALIGEKYNKEESLEDRLKNEGFTNIKVFTEKNKFSKDDIDKFDLLVSVRPCECEKLLINTNKFIILPCNCGGIDTKVCNYIRQYNNIKVWCGSQNNSIFGWYILYDF